MKTIGSSKFGFSAVNAGQRAVTFEPQFIAVSTEGNFRITAPVTKALGVEHGDYLMFLSNVNEIDEAIRNNDAELVSFCEENGIEFGSPEALIAIHKEFDMFAFAKGIQEFDTKGNVKTTSERLTKNDKLKFVSANFETMLTQAMDSENGASDEIKDALSRDGITKEEQMDILTTFVQPRELPKFKGSKLANPAGLSGVGVTLNFTDSAVWKQLKVDMGDTASEFNRIYDINLDEIQESTISDGYKAVSVRMIILKDYTDKEPSKLGPKDTKTGDAE